jgi:hypothetical protein
MTEVKRLFYPHLNIVGEDQVRTFSSYMCHSLMPQEAVIVFVVEYCIHTPGPGRLLEKEIVGRINKFSAVRPPML